MDEVLKRIQHIWFKLFGPMDAINKLIFAAAAFLLGIIIGFGLPGLITLILWAVALGLTVSGIWEMFEAILEDYDAGEDGKV